MPLAHILKFIKENPVSTGAQYVTLQKYFSHSNLLVYFFATPPIKLKTGIANRSGSCNSKPPGPIIMLGHWETLRGSQITFNILFCAGSIAMPFTSHGNLCNYTELKPISWAEPASFDFCCIQFYSADHIHHWRCSYMRLLESRWTGITTREMSKTEW